MANKKKETKTRTVKLREYNNKSRKGTYVWVKSKDRKGSLYKLREGTKIDDYIKNYEENKGKRTKTKKTTRRKVNIRRQLKRERKAKISKTINKGIGRHTITNINNATTQSINKHDQEILKTLVKDKQLLKILGTEENMKKIKNRLEHTIKITGEKGETIATITSIGNKTSREAIEEMKKTISKGTIMDEGYGTMKTRIEEKGYKLNYHARRGMVKNISITSVFRKG